MVELGVACESMSRMFLSLSAMTVCLSRATFTKLGVRARPRGQRMGSAWQPGTAIRRFQRSPLSSGLREYYTYIHTYIMSSQPADSLLE